MANFFSLFKPRKPPPPSRIDNLTYAIGDIHGRDDLFEKMIDAIRRDAEQFSDLPRIILLGDYIDRGKQSRDVINRILDLSTAGWCQLIPLMGNHEQGLIEFLEKRKGNAWCDHGGAETLASYGIQPPLMRANDSDWTLPREALASAMDPRHVEFLRNLELIYIDDDYLFVHAGVRPKLALSHQGIKTFLWIREPFLSAEKACDHVVVHGHTPTANLVNRRWRIGLDTGAYATGVLTAVRLKHEDRHFIQVKG